MFTMYFGGKITGNSAKKYSRNRIETPEDIGGDAGAKRETSQKNLMRILSKQRRMLQTRKRSEGENT